MRFRDVPPRDLSHRMQREGIRLRTGPFLSRIHAPYPGLADTIRFCYSDFDVDEESDFVDFHVAMVPPRGLRRFVRRQVLFLLDGQPLFEPYPGNLTMPLFEWGMNWCIAAHSHQYLILHAAVLERNGRALIMPAKPGSGKSTLCAALAHRGWRLFSDEMALIRPDDLAIVPVPRPVGLKNESIEVIRKFAPEAAIGPVWPDTSKGAVSHVRPPADSVARAAETAVPGWIVFPTYTAGAPARFTPHEKAGAFMRVADNSMNYSVLGEEGFDALTRVVDACGCSEFEYGVLDEAMEAFRELADGGGDADG